MATVTGPVGYAIATYFTERRNEFERDGTVIYHAPMGMAAMPLFTAEALSAARSEGKAEGMRGGPATHRHKKRGTEYVLIGIGKMQAERWREPDRDQDGAALTRVDMRAVAIYRSATDPTEIWVRPREEFEDGRFEALPPPPADGEAKL